MPISPRSIVDVFDANKHVGLQNFSRSAKMLCFSGTLSITACKHTLSIHLKLEQAIQKQKALHYLDDHVHICEVYVLQRPFYETQHLLNLLRVWCTSCQTSLHIGCRIIKAMRNCTQLKRYITDGILGYLRFSLAQPEETHCSPPLVLLGRY